MFFVAATEKLVERLRESRSRAVLLTSMPLTDCDVSVFCLPSLWLAARLSVKNYSSKQINDVSYVDYLRDLLKEYRIEPEYVQIEMTESLFLEKNNLSMRLFDRLQNMSIKLLLDDFGTGYSSLGYLTYVPIDEIKLDKSLVDAFLIEGKDSFIRDVILLVHDLNKTIVIEGVEQKWQYERLLEFEADSIQGYYFSGPLEADEAIDFEVKD